jgi:hypothetical protein
VKDNNLNLANHLEFFVENGITASALAVFIVDSSYTAKDFVKEGTGWPYIAAARQDFQIFRQFLPDMPFVICVVNQDRPHSLNNGGIRAALNASEDTRLISCIPTNRASVVCVLLELLSH